MRKTGILQYIRITALRRLLIPLLFLAVIVFILIRQPLFDYFRIYRAAGTEQLSAAVNQQYSYVRTLGQDLYYAGDDYYIDGALTGHYYYQLAGDYCRVYILKPAAGRPAEAYIASREIVGKLAKVSGTADQMLADLAEDLGWTAEGLHSVCDLYLVNEVVYFPPIERIFFVLVFLAALAGVAGALWYLLLMIFPRLSRTYRRLRSYGNAETLLSEADREVRSPILRAGNMVLTPKFLIEYDADRTDIVPLESALWVFDLQNLRWSLRERKMKMHYSLRIVTIAGHRFMLRNKAKADIDEIMTHLTDRYPNFFYGYSEEHEKMVHYILRENEREKKRNKKRR